MRNLHEINSLRRETDGLQVLGEPHANWSKAQSSPAGPFAVATLLSLIDFPFIYFIFSGRKFTRAF